MSKKGQKILVVKSLVRQIADSAVSFYPNHLVRLISPMALQDHQDGHQVIKVSNVLAELETESEDGEDLARKLHRIHCLQKDCLSRISHLEESLPSQIKDLFCSGSAGDARRSLETHCLMPMSFSNLTTHKDVEEEIYAYKRTLDQTNLFLETAIRDLLGRKIRRDCTSSQTESVAICAQEVASQTNDHILEDYHAQKLLFSLPNLEEEIANLRLDMATQTELQMDDFEDGAAAGSKDSNNVLIIYRNPSMGSFVWPYLIGVGAGAFLSFTFYSLTRFAVSFSVSSPVVAAPVPSR